MRDLARTDGGRAALQARVDELLPEMLCWFGPDGEDGVDELKAEGLLSMDSAELRAAYLADIGPVLRGCRPDVQDRRPPLGPMEPAPAPAVVTCPWCELGARRADRRVGPRAADGAVHVPGLPEPVRVDPAPVTHARSDDGVLLVALNRPDRRNAIDGEMADALRVAFENAADDGGVRAVILTGKGRAFSAGGDLSRFERDWDPREFRHDSHRLTQLISLVERLEKPTVAAINGVATGAGTQLALACDVRLMAADARFVYREGRLGIIPSHGGVTRLVKLIGLARARDVILGGEELSAAARRTGSGWSPR